MTIKRRIAARRGIPIEKARWPYFLTPLDVLLGRKRSSGTIKLPAGIIPGSRQTRLPLA
jgi:hypothetical protein